MLAAVEFLMTNLVVRTGASGVKVLHKQLPTK